MKKRLLACTLAVSYTHLDVYKRQEYNQAHATVYEQKEAVGHSVRAVYMYTAMAELASLYKDEKLYQACCDLWENMTQKRMYITGGIGSTVDGEASVSYTHLDVYKRQVQQEHLIKGILITGYRRNLPKESSFM